ncbi:hypothetical protein KJ763_02815 [Patescibacteria group bacterium]|nr:hypothetical protein [Patescibacteria group bacterium]
MATITIPKNLIKNDDLVVIPRKEYEEFLEIKKEERGRVTEKDVLRWSREAQKLKKADKLPTLRSLKEFR